ncbi:MAG: hypothetical protein HOP34_13610 [Methylococcaceae bacterium]|nr:hypothetical protein [Methylococcaceae bacterium]
MSNKPRLLIAALLIASLSACSSAFRFFNTQAYLNTDLIETSYDATEQLKDELKRKIPKNALIVVSTLLNVKKTPNETSSFGRIISNQIATALYDSGYRIIALDLPVDLFKMEDNGELNLSDKDKALLKRYQAAVMVGGVYAPGKQNTYVSLRAVDRFSKHVLASTDFSVPQGPDVKALLKTKDADAADMIPVGSAGSVVEPPEVDEEPIEEKPAAAVAPTTESAPIKLEEMPGTLK